MNSKIFRCGWCGNVTKDTGEPLPSPDRERAIRILENYGDYRTEKVTGWCCEEEAWRAFG